MSHAMHDTANTDRTSLESMPTEILEIIASNVPTLDTLWNLLRASPRCWRIFAIRYATITESVLSGPNSITPSLFREVIIVVALVRAQKFPFQSSRLFQLFMSCLVYCRRPNPYAYYTSATSNLCSLPDSRDAITSVVATAYHISALAQSLLSSCMQRLQRSNFYYIPAPPYPPSPGWPEHMGGFVHGVGQPTYVEEMRAVRALWIVQLFGEVKAMVESRPNIVCWSDIDISLLSQINLVSILPHKGQDIGLCCAAEVRTVMEYFPACYKNDTVFRLPQAPAPSEYNRWATTAPVDIYETQFALEFASHGCHLLRSSHFEGSDLLLPQLGFAFWGYARMWSSGLVDGFTSRAPWHCYFPDRHVCASTFETRTSVGCIASRIF